MLEYCPVQNVKKAKYPACLIAGGLHDPRVQYWEPAVRQQPLINQEDQPVSSDLSLFVLVFQKMAATLRHNHESGSGPVYLKIDMTSGHFSASDRYKYLKELAFDFAFMLDQLGLAK